MKRTIPIVMLAVALVGASALAGCSGSGSGSGSETTGTASTEATTAPGNTARPFKMVGKDKVYYMVTKTYDPATTEYAAMDGEPSQNRFFKPEHDEGLVNRDYPTYDAKTFKFLNLVSVPLAPQSYYMFDKNGGTMNAALKGTGYKATQILDGGHTKILPNLYVGYYDFAWVTFHVYSEYASGNESMNQELWKNNDYVVVGASFDQGNSLIAPPEITDVKQLDGKSVGIMNPGYDAEALFNSYLQTKGMATESAGGTVKIEMGSPGFAMNDLMSMKSAAVIAWSSYQSTLTSPQFGYKELVNWEDMGWGTKVPGRVLIVRRDILAQHPDIVQRVVQANYDATQACLKSQEWVSPITKAYDDFKQKYYDQAPRAGKKEMPSLDAQANPVVMKAVYDYMTKSGYFRVSFPYSSFADDSFYQKVKK
jgi:ABC-type nitrate/sulfonate/bicarbonate transport system substrate-binding protein